MRVSRNRQHSWSFIIPWIETDEARLLYWSRLARTTFLLFVAGNRTDTPVRLDRAASVGPQPEQHRPARGQYVLQPFRSHETGSEPERATHSKYYILRGEIRRGNGHNIASWSHEALPVCKLISWSCLALTHVWWSYEGKRLLRKDIMSEKPSL